MKKDDLKPFQTPRQFSDSIEAERELERCAGVDFPALNSIETEIFSDLDEKHFGVGWWVKDLPPRQRIAVSDHLLDCPSGVRSNLAEACLHFLEARQQWDQNETRLARMIQSDQTVKYPRPTCAADILPERLSTLHVAGIFRALGSTMDCLAALTIGVLGIPTKLIKADFSALRRWLAGTDRPKDSRHLLHTEFHVFLSREIACAGPEDWTDWLDNYRNMLVHRPRRLEPLTLDVEHILCDASGRPIPRSIPIPLLVRDPGLSNVEAFLAGTLYIPEDSRELLNSLLISVRALVGAVSTELLRIWRLRRASSTLLPQPRQQWPDIPQAASGRFSGYGSKKVRTNNKRAGAAPWWEKRLRAGALTDDQRHHWKTFPQ